MGYNQLCYSNTIYNKLDLNWLHYSNQEYYMAFNVLKLILQ